jgi:Transcriptional regulator
MEKKEDRRVTMTKQLLKNSLIEMLKAESIHQISIRALCEHADINRSTFYKYYGSQYELLKEMEADWLKNAETHINEMANSYESYAGGIWGILRYAEENIELTKLLLSSNVDPEFPPKLISFPDVQRLLDEGLPVRKDSSIAEYAAKFYINGAFSMITHWLNKDTRESPQEMARIILRIFEHVIGSEV